MTSHVLKFYSPNETVENHFFKRSYFCALKIPLCECIKEFPERIPHIIGVRDDLLVIK